LGNRLKIKAKVLIIFNPDQHIFIGEPNLEMPEDMSIYDFLSVIFRISLKDDLQEALPFLLNYSKLFNYTQKQFADRKQTLSNFSIKEKDIIVISMIPDEKLLIATIEKILSSIDMTIFEIKHGS